MNGIYGVNQNSYFDGMSSVTTGKKDGAQNVNHKASVYESQAAIFEKSKEVSTVQATKQVELSDKAKALLEKLQKEYGDTEFIIANYNSDAEAQRLLAGGTKAYSVLIEPELLEQMAADEDVCNKYMGILQESRNQFTEMLEQLGEKKDRVSFLGVAVNKDGKISFFAELDKVNEKQQERLEQSKEDKTRIYAGSVEELLEKARQIDLEKKEAETQEQIGSRFDFSV